MKPGALFGAAKNMLPTPALNTLADTTVSQLCSGLDNSNYFTHKLYSVTVSNQPVTNRQNNKSVSF